MDFVCFIIYGKFFSIWIIHEYRYAEIAALKPSRVEKPQMNAKKNYAFGINVFGDISHFNSKDNSADVLHTEIDELATI